MATTEIPSTQAECYEYIENLSSQERKSLLIIWKHKPHLLQEEVKKMIVNYELYKWRMKLEKKDRRRKKYLPNKH